MSGIPADITPPIATGCPPCHPVTRVRQTKKFPRNLVRELQRLAAFQYHFSATLALGAPLLQTVAQQKENSRAMLRKKESERKDVVQSIGKERGISIETKVSMGLLAQKEDDADREHRQMHFLALSKELDGAQKLLDVKILIAEKMLAPAGSSAWIKIVE